MRKRWPAFGLTALIAALVLCERKSEVSGGQSKIVPGVESAQLTDSHVGVSPVASPFVANVANADSKAFGRKAPSEGVSDVDVHSTERSNDELASALSRVLHGSDWLTLFRLADDAGDDVVSKDKHENQLNVLRQKADYFDSLLEAYSAVRVSPKLAIETAGLLELLADHPRGRRHAQSWAEKEMLGAVSQEVTLPEEAESEEALNASLSTDESMVLPIVAHEVFLRTTDSEVDRFEGTLKALRAQPNHNVRVAIFEAYARRAQARREELLARAQELGIVIPSN